MKIIAIIQARNGNSRLPNKGSMELLGKPMLYHIIERVKRATKLDQIVVAMPGAPEDQPLGWFCLEMRIPVFSGRLFGINDADIVSRYLEATGWFHADLIVRISADNPCIEPGEIDNLITEWADCTPDMLLPDNAENITEDYDGFGGELYTYDMLKWMDKTIADPFYREHPHKFWYDIHRFVYCGKKYPPGFRLDVDTPADYEKIKRIYDHFGHNHFHVSEVIEFLATNMEERPDSPRG